MSRTHGKKLIKQWEQEIRQAAHLERRRIASARNSFRGSRVSRAGAFIGEFVSSSKPHLGWHKPRRAKLGREVFGCYLDVFATGEDTVYLNQIACKPGEEGKGAGSNALMMLCFLADWFGVKIVGYAAYNLQLFGEDDFRLSRWYEKHGFEFPFNEWKHAGLKANMYRLPRIIGTKDKASK